MYKLNSLLSLIALAVVANGQQVVNNNSTLRPNNYININRQQHTKVIQDLDNQLDITQETYISSLNTIIIQLDMLVDSLVENDNKLKALEFLSDLSKQCVNKYRSLIPTISATKIKINNCFTTATNKLNNLLSNPRYTRDYLDSYYRNNFETGLNACQKTCNNLTLNYTMCVIEVVSAADTYTIKNQKTFNEQMDASHCSYNAYIKEALDCSYTTETETISAIAEANTLINKCKLGQDDCRQCSAFNTCSAVKYIYRSEIDYNSKTMNNPFYKRYDATTCLMLNIINN